MTFLVDTNVISEVMRREPHTQVKLWFAQQEVIALSVISLEEIYYGLLYKDARNHLDWLDRLLRFRAQVFPVTQAIAQCCGVLRARLRRQGITRSQADLLIAATAHQHERTLVTRNVKDFEGCDIRIFNPFDSSAEMTP